MYYRLPHPQTPPTRGGSGDIRLIPWASLITQKKFLSANHIAENTICSAAPEILGYFSTMTRHIFLCVNKLSVLPSLVCGVWGPIYGPKLSILFWANLYIDLYCIVIHT